MLDGDPNKRFSAKELYVRFSSDDSVNYKGFNFTFVAKTDTCKLSRALFLLHFVTVTPFCLKYVIIALRFHPGKNTSPPPPPSYSPDPRVGVYGINISQLLSAD